MYGIAASIALTAAILISSAVRREPPELDIAFR
jgi:hypothetical protein